MIKQSEYVVTYVTSTIASGSAKYKLLAEKKKNDVIDIFANSKRKIVNLFLYFC